MPRDVVSVRYWLRQPFERAVESVCKSLESRGLRVAGQLDVSGRVKRMLGIVLVPCRIVFVLPRSSAVVRDSIHPCAAIFLPLHVVISGDDAQTEIQVQNRVQAVPIVSETQAQISEAIGAIAMRPSITV